MEPDLLFAVSLARQTGELLCQYFQDTRTKSQQKPDQSIVTDADIAADHLISQTIKRFYPDDILISEELHPYFKDNVPGDVWVIDPLDGTTNFSLGLPVWGVLITRLQAGLPRLTAMYFPRLDEMYTAVSGNGAYLNGESIRVKPPDPAQPAAFFACCSRTFRYYRVSIPYKPRILGSAAYSFCALARGIAVVSFEATPKIWDIAGAWLLVNEAGGNIETYTGDNPFPLDSKHEYHRHNFPVLGAATPELTATARQKIQPL